MALVWVGAGAVAIGGAGASWSRVAAATALVGCLFWVMVPPVHAVSTTIDSPRPVDVTCNSALGELEGEPFVLTDTGPTFSPAHGACRAAGWERIAGLGTGELVVALLVWLGRRATSRRRTAEPATAGAR